MNKAVKKAFAVLFSVFMAAPTVVSAEGYTDTVQTTEGTIDKNLTGSITLYKYIDNNGVSADADGVALAGDQGSMADAIKEKLNDDGILPEKGVRFKLLKVADIEQITNDKSESNDANSQTSTGLNVSGTYYTNLDDEFFETMNKYLGSDRLVPADSTKSTDKKNNGYDGKDGTRFAHYESDELNEKMMDVNRSPGIENGTDAMPRGEVALNRIVRQRNVTPEGSTDTGVGYCKSFDLTNDNGYTALDNLPLGLYLICEVDYEHSALSKHDQYWEVVKDNYNDQIGDGNINSSINDYGKTEDAETGTDDGNRHSQLDGNVRNSSTAAGSDAGGSNYADIVSPCSPFLISVPTTNTASVKGSDGETHAPGTVWQYDITAYPKNGSLTIHKDIVVNEFASNNNGTITNDGNDTQSTETLCDFHQTNYLPETSKKGNTKKLDGDNTNGLTHQIDANIGDIVTQLVSVDVPRLVDDIDDENDVDDHNNATGNVALKKGDNTNTPGANSTNERRKHNSTFIVTDRMTKGLSLIEHDPDQNHFTIKLGQGRWNDNGEILTQGTDYSVDYAADRKSFVLTMLPAGLAKLDDIPTASYLYIKYDTVLTKDALIGTDTYGSQRTVVKDANAKAANTNDQGTKESDLKNDNVTDHVETAKDTYTSTYTTGPNGDQTTTVNHDDATNQNTAELTYATDRTQKHDYYSNTVKVFTYELDLTKTFTDGTQGHVSKNDTEGTNNNNKEFDYSKVRFTVRGLTKSNSVDGKLASTKDENGYVKHAYGYGSIPVLDVNNKNQARTGNDEDKGGITRLFNNSDKGDTWEQMLFIKTGDGTYRVWDPLSDNNAAFDDAADTTSLDTTYKGAAADKTEDYTSAANVGTVSKYLIPNTKTGLLTIKGLDSRTYEFTEVSTAPGRNLMAENFYVELLAPMTNNGKTEGPSNQVKIENGSIEHAYVWTGAKPADLSDNDIRNYPETKARLDIGRVPLAVQNNEIIKVLKTGGNGVYLYVAAGAGIIALGVYMMHRKKKEEEQNAGSEA